MKEKSYYIPFNVEDYYGVKYTIKEAREEEQYYDDYDESETFDYWFNFTRDEEMELEEFA